MDSTLLHSGTPALAPRLLRGGELARISEISLKGLALATMFKDEPLEPSRLLETPDRIDRSLSAPTTS